MSPSGRKLSREEKRRAAMARLHQEANAREYEDFGSSLAYTIMVYEMESGIKIDRYTNGLWLIQRLKMLPRYLEQKYGTKKEGSEPMTGKKK